MNTPRRGFTLVELLVVIAIISILASLTAVVLPRVLERAKLSRVDGALNQIRTAMTAYYTDHGTYPPRYGYLMRTAEGQGPAFNLKPYTAILNVHGDENLYDEFSLSYDTTGDGIGLLEFHPLGTRPLPTSPITFPTAGPYNMVSDPALNDEVSRQLAEAPRPFVYLPVNVRQFRQAQRYWVEKGDFYAETWFTPEERPPGMNFPPPNYDAFVLLGVGPAVNSFGVLPEPINAGEPEEVYHITAMRAFFLATRDLNDNGLLDFHFEARTRHNEGAQEYMVGNMPADNRLPPNNIGRNAAGPYIYVFGL